MSTPRINAAASATEAAEAAIAKAARALEAPRFVNGFGVYADRSTVIANIAAGKLFLENAIAAIRSVPWPTDADYGEG